MGGWGGGGEKQSLYSTLTDLVGCTVSAQSQIKCPDYFKSKASIMLKVYIVGSLHAQTNHCIFPPYDGALQMSSLRKTHHSNIVTRSSIF